MDDNTLEQLRRAAEYEVEHPGDWEYAAAFDPPAVLALLDEVARLLVEIEGVDEVLDVLGRDHQDEVTRREIVAWMVGHKPFMPCECVNPYTTRVTV